MNPSLRGCGSKLDRAETHLIALEREVVGFPEDAYRVVTHIEAEGFEQVSRIYQVRQIPQHWSLLVGDCLHNLRTALDHLVYDLALCVQNPLPPEIERTSAFVIADTKERFDNKRWHLKGISPEALEAVIDVQPYGTEKPTENLLWLLEALENIDKHRRLHVLGALIKSHYFTTPLPDIVQSDTGNLGWARNGLEFRRIKFRKPQSEPYFDVEQPVQISIEEVSVPAAASYEITDLLKTIKTHIMEMVPRKFGEFFT